jgi:hypothetical protein
MIQQENQPFDREKASAQSKHIVDAQQTAACLELLLALQDDPSLAPYLLECKKRYAPPDVAIGLTPKPARPQKQALQRLSNAVNELVEAYEQLEEPTQGRATN